MHRHLSSNRSLTRREFLTVSATVTTGAAMGMPVLRNVSGNVAAQSELIDLHHHMLPPVYLAKARDRVIAGGQGYLPASVLQWTPARSIAEMDTSGVRTAILSISTPGVWFGNTQDARVLARECNEYAARLVADYPGRFGFFAAVPLPDTEGSIREIAYALDVLKADGIGLMTSYGDKWPGDPAYAATLEELHRRKATVYFHPTAPACCGNLMPNVPQSTIEYPHDTTRAVTSLLFSGTLTRLPDIKYVFSHSGGTLPMLAARIARRVAVKEIAEQLPNGVEYELKRLYYEVAATADRPAMAALTTLVPVSQIVFGSDYPWVRIGLTADDLGKSGLSPSDLSAIQRANALRLFPRFGA